MIRVLAREGDLANALERDGSFNLIITIDDKNRVIACGTQPNKTFDRKLFSEARMQEVLRVVDPGRLAAICG